VSRVHLSKGQGQDYLFKSSKLEFLESNIENKFASLRCRTLSYTILQEKYRHLSSEVTRRYSADFQLSLSDFLSALKKSGDPFYKNFLNMHGDKTLCKFRMLDSANFDKTGLYLYCLDNIIMYVGITKDSFKKRINSGYGNISPKNCYLDGQATDCHLNSLINKVDHTRLSFWSCVLDDIKDLNQIEKHLIQTLKPSWNLALKPIQKSNSLYFTHCSESKNPKFKNSTDATTPDVLYTSDRIKSFFDYVKEEDVSWAIFSDKYGFVFPSTLIHWYDLAPDDVTQEEVDRLLDDSFDELRKYEKIVYRTGSKPLHPTYEALISAMKSKGLNVVVESD